MKRKEMLGKRFTRLLVVKEDGKIQASIGWLCKCDCGNVVRTTCNRLTSGITKSCGCWRNDLHKTHGMSDTKEYKTWQRAIHRCQSKYPPTFKHYGARGIKVCARWRYSFPNFLKDMGPMPLGRKELDRINNDGNYEPRNCRWANRGEQIRNQRRTVWVTHNGETLTMDKFVVKHGVSYSRFRRFWRVEGMSIEDSLARCRIDY